MDNGTTVQQCGSEMVLFTCPKAQHAYNEYIGYVDLVDFDMKIGGSFTHESCFKKWYKKGFLGILDFILVNVMSFRICLHKSKRLSGIQNSAWIGEFVLLS